MAIRKRAYEALADLRQRAESVTRSARIDIESGDVDEIDPPDDIDELYELYEEVGIIRKSINKFAGDVSSPGASVDAEDDATEAYFNGGDEAPDDAPTGGFLKNCAVIAGERHQPFKPLLDSAVTNRWARGTVLVELLKEDDTEPDSPITGFKMIQPETIYARTYPNSNVLIAPDDDSIEVDNDETTKRGENAAYVQFDDRSIIGRRLNRFSDTDGIPLSQNDVHKQVLDPNLGGSEDFESGVFGTPITAAVADDAEEYKSIKRDRARAIKTKAYGVWSAEFDTEVIETPSANEQDILKEWNEDEQDEWVDNVGDLGPGDIIGHDGNIELDAWEPTVPDLNDELAHYVEDILSPLPTPKYMVAFGSDINQFVAERQEAAYKKTIKEERRYQERQWTQVFRTVAERHPDLDPTGLKVKIEPDDDESPIRSMDSEDIEKVETYTKALKNVFPSGVVANMDRETLFELVLQLPEDEQEEAMSELAELDESDEQVEKQFEELMADS